MSSSDLSSLSSLPSSDEEPSPKLFKLRQLPLSFKPKSASLSPSPEPAEKEPSPPHEYVLADNDDIAVIVMFRSRFAEAFPKSIPNLGPQDIERGVVDISPSMQVENLLCALLALVLNRKKHIERQHYGRALEEALQTHKAQWPLAWEGVSPLSGGQTFTALSPTQRLHMLRILTWWSLSSSEVIARIIKDSYKQQRQENDLNQPLSVQSWGNDARKRRYWLIEGQHDTPFRLYRESNPKLVHNTWWTVAGTIDEIKAIADGLILEKSQAGKRLSACIMSAIPRLEVTEEKRKRKEYRQNRRAQFERPHPGFSLYEGRTRGKRARYTFSDEEDDEYDDSVSEAPSLRRSSRNDGLLRASNSDGDRQVRYRFRRPDTDVLLGPAVDGGSRYSTDAGDSSDILESKQSMNGTQRPSRAKATERRVPYCHSDELSDEERLESGNWTDEIGNEGNQDEDEYQDDGRGEDDEHSVTDEDENFSLSNKTLIVRLPYRKPHDQAVMSNLQAASRDLERSTVSFQTVCDQSAPKSLLSPPEDTSLHGIYLEPSNNSKIPTTNATDPKTNNGLSPNDVFAQSTNGEMTMGIRKDIDSPPALFTINPQEEKIGLVQASS